MGLLLRYSQVVTAIICVLLLAGEEDLRDVRSAVADLAAYWKDLGISLGVRPADLETILQNNSHSLSHCLRDMLFQWLTQAYNVGIIYYSMQLLLYCTNSTGLVTEGLSLVSSNIYTKASNEGEKKMCASVVCLTLSSSFLFVLFFRWRGLENQLGDDLWRQWETIQGGTTLLLHRQ